MMDRTLLERLLEISPEEKRYQNGLAEIQKDLYTRSGSFEIDSALFLKLIFRSMDIIISRLCMYITGLLRM